MIFRVEIDSKRDLVPTESDFLSSPIRDNKTEAQDVMNEQPVGNEHIWESK